jgi:Flp pilus assembly protein TadD
MSLRALGEHTTALDHFRIAYAANTENPDVGREYGAQCFVVGDHAEGLRVNRELHERFPDDAGLQANFALGLLIGGGDLGEALAVAKAAQKRDPTDAITGNLIAYIEDVRAGRKARPTRMPGI